MQNKKIVVVRIIFLVGFSCFVFSFFRRIAALMIGNLFYVLKVFTHTHIYICSNQKHYLFWYYRVFFLDKQNTMT